MREARRAELCCLLILGPVLPDRSIRNRFWSLLRLESQKRFFCAILTWINCYLIPLLGRYRSICKNSVFFKEIWQHCLVFKETRTCRGGKVKKEKKKKRSLFQSLPMGKAGRKGHKWSTFSTSSHESREKRGRGGEEVKSTSSKTLFPPSPVIMFHFSSPLPPPSSSTELNASSSSSFSYSERRF